jgi:hypothetical protein
MATVVQDMAMVANTAKAGVVVMVIGGRHKGGCYMDKHAFVTVSKST